MSEATKTATDVAELLKVAEVLAVRAEHLENQLRKLSATSDIKSVTVQFVGDWPKRGANSVPAERHANYKVPPIPAVTLQPYPGHCAVSLFGKANAVAGFSVIGLSNDELRSFIETVAKRQRKEKSFFAVFLTDSDNFQLFRKHGFVFEYIPPKEDRATRSGLIEWEERVSERTSCFQKKWGVSSMFVASAAAQLVLKA